jgi:hypothetical protein
MKYGNKKVTVDGIEFDSKKEAQRYCELKLLQRAGVISKLELQKEFELIPTQRIDGKVVERACKYKADFAYIQNGRQVVEDVKGYRDPKSAGYAKFVIKRKLMLEKFGIRVIEV